jgi:hypothetical protein
VLSGIWGGCSTNSRQPWFIFCGGSLARDRFDSDYREVDAAAAVHTYLLGGGAGSGPGGGEYSPGGGGPPSGDAYPGGGP